MNFCIYITISVTFTFHASQVSFITFWQIHAVAVPLSENQGSEYWEVQSGCLSFCKNLVAGRTTMKV